MTKLSKKKVREALKDSGGVLATIAERCNVSRAAVTYFFNRNPDMKGEVEQEQERIVDTAEKELFRLTTQAQAESVRLQAIRTLLAQKRGYTEKQETIHAGELKLTNENVVTKLRKITENVQ